MKIVINIIFLIGLLYSHTCFSQNTYQGKLIDSQTNKPLPYVNIGVIGKNIGTVSDTKGAFTLEIPTEYEKDTLKISMVGYESLICKVSDFRKILLENSILKLQEDKLELAEVSISSKKIKKGILGNRASSSAMVGGFASNILGNEVGVRIKIKRSPTYITSFSTFITKNKYDKVKFRLNFYDLKDGKPHKSILRENIIVSTDIRKGKLTVDLTQYNIVVENDFLVSLEWIEDLGKNGLLFAAGFFGRAGFYRETSQGNWQKMGATVSVGFHVNAEY